MIFIYVCVYIFTTTIIKKNPIIILISVYILYFKNMHEPEEHVLNWILKRLLICFILGIHVNK